MSLMHPRVARNYAKKGFFPTDNETTRRIANMLNAEPDAALKIFDPCCGEGEALRYCAGVLSQFGAHVESYGIEIDDQRAFEAKAKLDVCLRADINDCVIGRRQYGLLWLNPPYGDLMKDHSNLRREVNAPRKRLEKEFLKMTHHSLLPGGVFVYIVPHYSLDKEACLWISKAMDNVRVFRAPEQRFKQAVIIGNKLAKIGVSNRTIREDLLVAANKFEDVPELPNCDQETLYSVPSSRNASNKLHSIKVDADQLTSAVSSKGGLWRDFSMLFSSVQSGSKRPLCKLSNWHLAISLAAGDISGVVTSKSGKVFLIKGDTHKIKKDQVETSADLESDSVVVTRTSTDQFVPVIRGIDFTPKSTSYGRTVIIR